MNHLKIILMGIAIIACASAGAATPDSDPANIAAPSADSIIVPASTEIAKTPNYNLAWLTHFIPFTAGMTVGYLAGSHTVSYLPKNAAIKFGAVGTSTGLAALLCTKDVQNYTPVNRSLLVKKVIPSFGLGVICGFGLRSISSK
jgi:hypothetical protein